MHVGSVLRAVHVHIMHFLPFMHAKSRDMWNSRTCREGSSSGRAPILSISLRIVHALGICKNQYIRFVVSKNKVIIKPIESNITKKDMAEANRNSAALDRYGEQKDVGYMGDLAEALARRPDDTEFGRIEKIKMK